MKTTHSKPSLIRFSTVLLILAVMTGCGGATSLSSLIPTKESGGSGSANGETASGGTSGSGDTTGSSGGTTSSTRNNGGGTTSSSGETTPATPSDGGNTPTDEKQNSEDSNSDSSTCTVAPEGSANSDLNTTGILTAAPMDAADYDSTTALGNLQADGHPTPTDHIYFMLKSNAADSAMVYAAADATVSSIFDLGNGEYKIVFKVDRSFYYYYAHVHLLVGITAGRSVKAGDPIGTNSGRAAAVDMGVINHNITLTGFVNTCRWTWERHADAPLKYYSGNLATTLYSKVNRVGDDKDGKIDYDVKGQVVGNWVKKGLPETDMSTYSQYMAFVYDLVDPRQMRISIGGTVGTAGVYGVQDGATDFKSATAATGKVAYKLYEIKYISAAPASTQTGLLIVQVIDDASIKVQFFAGVVSDAEFDGDAFTYVR